MARQVPTNYILLGIFTLSESYIVSFICGLTNPEVVLVAAIMTLGITCSLTYYALTTKSDFTMAGATLFIVGMAFALFCMLGIIF